jgi:DNA polymerase-3 subunit delta'
MLATSASMTRFTLLRMPMPDDPSPRATADLIGHTAAEAGLLKAWESGRLAHGWLITGPPGIGKATLAFRFARFVLAGGAGEGALFGAMPASSLALAADHPVFRQVAAAGHPDLLTIERLADEKSGKLKTSIAVEQVRKIADFLHLTAGAGGWRVVIVDTVDDLNANAANAMLKILEEPTRRALLLLVCNAPGSVLATIRSRCRRLDLSPLADGDLDALLARLRPDLEPAARRPLARLAEGSIGRALGLADEEGLELYRGMVTLIGGLPAAIEAAHALSDRLARANAEPAYDRFCTLYGWWLARTARAAAAGQGIEEIIEGEAKAAQHLVERIGLERLVEVWEKTAQLFAQADGLNLDRKQVILNAFLALS